MILYLFAVTWLGLFCTVEWWYLLGLMTKKLLIHSLFVAFNQNPAEKGFNSLILISLTDQKHPFWQKRKRTKISSLQHNFDNKLSKTEALIIISSSAINCALWDYDCFTVNMQTTDIHTFCMIFFARTRSKKVASILGLVSERWCKGSKVPSLRNQWMKKEWVPVRIRLISEKAKCDCSAITDQDQGASRWQKNFS